MRKITLINPLLRNAIKWSEHFKNLAASVSDPFTTLRSKWLKLQGYSLWPKLKWFSTKTRSWEVFKHFWTFASKAQ